MKPPTGLTRDAGGASRSYAKRFVDRRFNRLDPAHPRLAQARALGGPRLWTEGPTCCSQGHRPWTPARATFGNVPKAPTGRSASRAPFQGFINLMGLIFSRGDAPGYSRLGLWPNNKLRGHKSALCRRM